MSLPLTVIPGSKLMDRWNMSYMELAYMAWFHGLRMMVKAPTPNSPFESVDSENTFHDMCRLRDHDTDQNEPIRWFVFNLDDVGRIEKENKDHFSNRETIFSLDGV